MGEKKVTLQFVPPELVEKYAPLIHTLGGLDGFRFSNTKIEWKADETDGGRFRLEHNFSQVHTSPVLLPSELKNTFAEVLVGIEQSLVWGMRYEGTPDIPQMAGGLYYFLTTEAGAHVVQGDGRKLTPRDVDDTIGNLPGGLDLVVCGVRACRLLRAAKWNRLPFILSLSLPKEDVFLLRKDSVAVGCREAQSDEGTWSVGRLHARTGLEPSVVYADVSFMIREVERMGRLTGFAV